MSIDEKAFKESLRIHKKHTGYFSADMCRQMLEAYEAAKAPEQPCIKPALDKADCIKQNPDSFTLQPDGSSPHHPAAFINVIAEDGTKDEAIKYLQETWNECCELRKQLKRESGTLLTVAKAIREIMEEQKMGMLDDGEVAYRLLNQCDDLDIALSDIEGGK